MSMIRVATLKALSDYMMDQNSAYRIELGVAITNETDIPAHLRAIFKSKNQDQSMFVMDSRSNVLETWVTEHSFHMTTTFGGTLHECIFPLETILYICDTYDNNVIMFGRRNVEAPVVEEKINPEVAKVLAEPEDVATVELTLHDNPDAKTTERKKGHLTLVVDNT